MKDFSLTLILSLCLVTVACQDNPSGANTDTGSSDVSDTADVDRADTVSADGTDLDADSDCAETCEEAFTCVDGKVYYQPGDTNGCNGGCDMGTVRASCDKGCLESADVEPILYGANAHQLCAEHEFRRLYDPCTEDSHCEPASGQPLVCDEQIRRCVDADEPEYLTPCELDTSQTDTGKGYVDATGAVDPGCEGLPFCIIERESYIHCSGCTRKCTSDDDCPAASECKTVDALSGDGEPLSLCVSKGGFALFCQGLE